MRLVDIDWIRAEICKRADECTSEKDALIMINNIMNEAQEKERGISHWIRKEDEDEGLVHFICEHCEMTFELPIDTTESFSDFNYCSSCGCIMANPNGEQITCNNNDSSDFWLPILLGMFSLPWDAKDIKINKDEDEDEVWDSIDDLDVDFILEDEYEDDEE